MLSSFVVQPESSSATHPRARLTREGSAFLSNYARTVNPNPHKTEKLAILASLRAIPGNDAVTLQRIGNWFIRHRKLSRNSHPPVLLDDETILFPRLTPTHFQQLRVLYRERAEPSEGIITFWADRIHADRAEVAAWIQYQQEKAKENNASTLPESPNPLLRDLAEDSVSDSPSASPTASALPHPHLPTPAKSLSPSVSPLLTRLPSLPPIAVKVEDARQCLSPLASSDTPLLQTRPAASRSAFLAPPSSKSQPMPAQRAKMSLVAASAPDILTCVDGETSSPDSNATLAASIRDSLRLDRIPNEQPPRTVDEFAEKFQEVESMIDSFMEKYDSGQLVRLGWDSSLRRAAL